MEFSTNELVWAIINFVVFLLLLRVFLYRPVLKLLDARRDEIQGNLAQAETARKEAEAARAEYERQAAKARDEAQAVISRAMISEWLESFEPIKPCRMMKAGSLSPAL